MARFIPVLMYHKLGTPPPGAKVRSLYVSPTRFERHLLRLHRLGFEFIDFLDLKAAQEGGKPLPPQPILITFDDGHLDNYTFGLPLFKRYQVRATIFVVAGDLGKQGVVWSEAKESHPTDLMTWNQARELKAAGVSIQDHGWQHRHADRRGREELLADYTQSRAKIQAELGEAPVVLAYPYGSFNDITKAAAKEAGYTFACSTEKNIYQPDISDPFTIGRIPISGYRWLHEVRFFWKSRGWGRGEI